MIKYIQISFERAERGYYRQLSDNVGAMMIVNDITRCCHLLRPAYDQPFIESDRIYSNACLFIFIRGSNRGFTDIKK